MMGQESAASASAQHVMEECDSVQPVETLIFSVNEVRIFPTALQSLELYVGLSIVAPGGDRVDH